MSKQQQKIQTQTPQSKAIKPGSEQQQITQISQDTQIQKNQNQKRNQHDGFGTQSISQSILNDSSNSSDEEEENEEIEVKERGFRNYFEQYYSNNTNDTIFKNYYKPEVLTKELKKSKIKISDLSVTKYYSSIVQKEDERDFGQSKGSVNQSNQFKSLNKASNFGAIFTLPRIKYSQIENSNNSNNNNKNNHAQKNQHQNKIASGFVSFQNIKDMNGILLQSIEQDYSELDNISQIQSNNPSVLIKEVKDLFLNKKENNKSCFMSTKNFMEKSFSYNGDKSQIKNSYYTNKQKLQYTLQHNKFNENQLKELDYQEQLKSIQKLQSILEHQKKITMKQQYRKYPSIQPLLNNKQPFFGSVNINQLQEPKVQEEDEQQNKRISNLNISMIQQESKLERKLSMSSSRRSQFISSTPLSQDNVILSRKQSGKYYSSPSKPKKSDNKTKNLTNLYPCFAIQNEEVMWKPEVRELFKIAFNGEQIYLFGGCSSKPMSDMCVFNIPQNKWNQVNSLSPEEGRYNHMMGMYKKSVIIFGGEKFEGQSEQKTKVCVNDTRIFYPEKNEWKYMRPTGDIIEPRRNASSSIVGRYLIIQGGISQKGTFLNDLWVLDIMNHRWNSGQCEDRNQYMSEGRAYHTSCPVFHPERKSVDLFKEFSEKTTEKQHMEIKQEGVYFFGGQSQSGQANNQLTILITYTRPMYFTQPETIGKPPDARYNHSLSYNQKLKILIVYGGRNENLSQDSTFLDDLFILQLGDMQWFECATIGRGIERRSNHQAVCYDTQILIFGGLGENGYYSFETYRLELDKKKSKQHIIDSQLRQKELEIQSLKRAKTIKGNANTTSQKRQEKVLEHENFIKSLQQESEGLKSLVEKLNFKNYTSFLPLPVIFKRKRSNSNISITEAEKIKKDELDSEVIEHIKTERKQNETYLRQNSNSPQSPSSTPQRRSSLHHSFTTTISEQKQLPPISSPLSKQISLVQNKSIYYKNNNGVLLPSIDNNQFMLPK